MIPTEKLTLLMLSEIHHHLRIEGSIDPILVRNSVIREGYIWLDSFGVGQTIRDEDIAFVLDVLRMWQDIETSMEILSSGDRDIFFESIFSARPARGYRYSLFDGFGCLGDGNYAALYEHIVNDLGLFPYFKNRQCDAETAGLIGSYQRMLPVYHDVKAASTGPTLSLDELKLVLGEHGIPLHEPQIGTWEEPRYDITDL